MGGTTCRMKGQRVQEGGKGRRLALGLLAAVSFPLATLAHLHLCQLDVSEHVGVCRENGTTGHRG